MSTQHFTIFGGSCVHEARGFNRAPRKKGAVVVWGVVLASLLFAVTTAATVTASTWAQAAGAVY